MAEHTQKALFESEDLHIADKVLSCAVLEDGTRLLASSAFLTALGRPWKGTYKRTDLPNFLDILALKSFIDEDLRSVLNPVEYLSKSGKRKNGYPAELLPKVCDVYLNARDAHALDANPNHLAAAKAADMIMRGLAHVGIIALVDEATGYQEIRDRQELQKYLDTFLRKEYAKWAKRFPDEFYKELFRLKGWQWKGMKVNRPSVVGHYTKDIVYSRLAPGVLKELESRNPPDDSGRRKVKHHQFLSEDVGHPVLYAHIIGTLAIMRASPTWAAFQRSLARSFPKYGDTGYLGLEEPDE